MRLVGVCEACTLVFEAIPKKDRQTGLWPVERSLAKGYGSLFQGIQQYHGDDLS